MKIALTVISRTHGIEIEKRYESEVMEMFIADPAAADYCDPVLAGFVTLAKAHRASDPRHIMPTQPTDASQPHYVDKAVGMDLNTKL